MSLSQDNLLLAKKLYKHFFAGEIDEFFGMFDENVELLEAASLPYGGVYRGRETVRKLIMTVTTVWNDISLDIKTITSGDDYVIAYGQFSATSAKTGVSVSFPLAEVWRFREGRVIYLHPVYGDVQLASAALA
jgi:uncharacterized protein